MAEREELLKRITVRPGVCGGKPIIRDMRMAVEHVLGYLAAGDSVESILRNFPFLEPEDIQACLLHAYLVLTGKPAKILTERDELLKRITARSDVLGGKPIIRDMRMAVEHVLGKMAAGDSVETILRNFPFLEPEDIQACFLHAYLALDGEGIPDRVTLREAS